MSDFIHRTTASNHPQTASRKGVENTIPQCTSEHKQAASLATAIRAVKAILTDLETAQAWYSCSPDQLALLADILVSDAAAVAAEALKHWPPCSIARLGSLGFIESYAGLVPVYAERLAGAGDGAAEWVRVPGHAPALTFTNADRLITWSLTR